MSSRRGEGRAVAAEPRVPAIEGAAARERLRLRVNGDDYDVVVAPSKTLLEVLREDLGLTGTKHGCELGECGACTVRVDDEPLLSCLLLAVEVEDRQITTVEGLATNGRQHELQIAFSEKGAAQCGYCTSGILMSASALLEAVPEPDREQIKEHLAGNLCRCTGYLQILEAVETAAQRLVARNAASDPAVTAAGAPERSKKDGPA